MYYIDVSFQEDLEEESITPTSKMSAKCTKEIYQFTDFV